MSAWRRCSDDSCEVWWTDGTPDCWACGNPGTLDGGPVLNSQVGAPLFLWQPPRPDTAA